MSLDSPYDQQERYIAYGTGIYFIIVVWTIYIQLRWPTITTANNSTIGSIPQVIESALPTDYLTVASLTTISFAVGYFLKYLGIHDWLDNALFHFVNRLNSHINSRFKSYFEELGNQEELHKDEEFCKFLSMPIFYEFINKQQDSWVIQRALFFSFMLKYRLSMNLILLSIFGNVVNLITLLIVRNHNFENYSYWIFMFFTIVGFAALLISQKKLPPKILQITDLQLDRIIYDNSTALNTMFINRLRKLKH